MLEEISRQHVLYWVYFVNENNNSVIDGQLSTQLRLKYSETCLPSLRLPLYKGHFVFTLHVHMYIISEAQSKCDRLTAS